VNQLKGEKIDVVPWSPDASQFVANALQPAKVKEVRIDPNTQTAMVIVPDYQLSLAIGKEGQNARLAARLTGWRIDIKSETQFSEEGRRPAATEAAPSEAEEAPVEEAPAAEEAPVEEAPAAEEAPVEEAPAAEEQQATEETSAANEAEPEAKEAEPEAADEQQAADEAPEAEAPEPEAGEEPDSPEDVGQAQDAAPEADEDTKAAADTGVGGSEEA
jgi:N utilization substance protein A